MTSDQEPRYRLVDSDGNIVGSLYGKADGSVAIQETTSGSDREVALAPDGTFSAPSVKTPSLSADDLNTSRSWVDVTSSRDFDVQETNDTDSEIKVWGRIDVTANDTSVNFRQRVNGTQYTQTSTVRDSGERVPFIIPAIGPGDTYLIEAFGDTEDYEIQTWGEFRP